MSVQEALKLMRLELGLTQEDLAKKIGKTFATVNRWENGKGFPSRENAKSILQLAKSGGVSEECFNYLEDTLMPDTRRPKAATEYGFPTIDREFLFTLADWSMNALYVIEADTYNLLYVNRMAEKTAAQYWREKGFDIEKKDGLSVLQRDNRCFRYFGNNDSPCEFCPLNEVKQFGFTDKTIHIPGTERIVRIHVKSTKLNSKAVYVIYLMDVSDQVTERLALYELTNEISKGVGIYNVYYDDRIELTFMNEHLYKMIGVAKRDELLVSGMTDLSMIHHGDRAKLKNEIKVSIAEKRPLYIEVRMQSGENQYRYVRLDAKQIHKDPEKITFYCLFSEVNMQSE